MLTLKSVRKKAYLLFSIVLIVGLGLFVFGVNAALIRLDLLNGNAALGSDVIGTYLDINDPNEQSVSFFTATSNLQVTDIFAYIAGGSNGHAMAAIYQGDNDAPGALIEQSSQVAVGTDFSWVDFHLGTPISVSSGGVYGLAVMGDVPLSLFMVGGVGQRTGGPGLGSFALGFSDPFGTLWFNDPVGAMSIYASGASPSPTPTPNPNGPMHQLTVTFADATQGTGQVDPAGASSPYYSYPENTPITVLAIPNQGYEFDYFLVTMPSGGSMHYTSNPYSAFLTSNINVEIHFKVASTTPPPPVTTNYVEAALGAGITGFASLGIGLVKTGKMF